VFIYCKNVHLFSPEDSGDYGDDKMSVIAN
jgi:hypothetical protein